MIRCLGLLGVTNFAELDKSYLHPAAPTNLPHVFSAFPLLDIEPTGIERTASAAIHLICALAGSGTPRRHAACSAMSAFGGA